MVLGTLPITTELFKTSVLASTLPCTYAILPIFLHLNTVKEATPAGNGLITVPFTHPVSDKLAFIIENTALPNTWSIINAASPQTNMLQPQYREILGTVELRGHVLINQNASIGNAIMLLSTFPVNARPSPQNTYGICITRLGVICSWDMRNDGGMRLVPRSAAITSGDSIALNGIIFQLV